MVKKMEMEKLMSYVKFLVGLNLFLIVMLALGIIFWVGQSSDISDSPVQQIIVNDDMSSNGVVQSEVVQPVKNVAVVSVSENVQSCRDYNDTSCEVEYFFLNSFYENNVELCDLMPSETDIDNNLKKMCKVIHSKNNDCASIDNSAIENMCDVYFTGDESSCDSLGDYEKGVCYRMPYMIKALELKDASYCNQMPMIGSFNEENRKNVCLSFFS